MYVWGALDITWVQWYKTRIIMVSSGIYRTSHCYLDSNPSISQSPSLLKYILVFAALIELYFFFIFSIITSIPTFYVIFYVIYCLFFLLVYKLVFIKTQVMVNMRAMQLIDDWLTQRNISSAWGRYSPSFRLPFLLVRNSCIWVHDK